MSKLNIEAFNDELMKIAFSSSDVADFLTRTPHGAALLGAGLGAGAGAGIGALTGKKGERKKRALIGAGLGAGVGGLSGAAVGYARRLPEAKVLQMPEAAEGTKQISNFTRSAPRIRETVARSGSRASKALHASRGNKLWMRRVRMENQLGNLFSPEAVRTSRNMTRHFDGAVSRGRVLSPTRLSRG